MRVEMADEIKPTDKIQLQSVVAYMSALGYEHFNFCPSDNFFYSSLECNKHRANVSFRTACQLHNGALYDWAGDWYGNDRPNWKFNTYAEIRACASKIVDNVKLQWDKKKKRIICQNHLVKWAHEDYYEIFLGDKE